MICPITASRCRRSASHGGANAIRLNQSFLVDFMEAMVSALDMEKPIYVGCSMGGHLAPDLALLRPGLFRAVVAVEGGLATHDPEPFNKYLSHPRASNEAKAALMMSQTSPKSPEPHRRETVWVYSQGAPQVFQGDLDYYLGEHDLTTTASQIDTSKTQVHVISGDYDWSATPERCKALADAIPGATYTRMEGMGHFPMSEDPVSFERYLAGTPRPDRDRERRRPKAKQQGELSLHGHRQYRQVCDHQGCRTRAALRAGA